MLPMPPSDIANLAERKIIAGKSRRQRADIVGLADVDRGILGSRGRTGVLIGQTGSRGRGSAGKGFACAQVDLQQADSCRGDLHLEDRASIIGTATAGQAEEVTAAVLGQAAGRVCPVGAVEGNESGDGAAAGLDLEHRAVPIGTAAFGRSEEVAAAVLDQAAAGVGPVGAVEGGERGDDAAAGRDLEHCTVPNKTATGGRAEEVAAAVLDQAARGVGPVGAVEGGERGDDAAAGHDLEHRTIPNRTAIGGRAEEVAAAVLNQAAAGVGPVSQGDERGDGAATGLRPRTPCRYYRGRHRVVVPKRLPLLSSTKPPTGFAPLVPLKEASVVMTPLLALTSNTVPRSAIIGRTALVGRAEEVAAAVLDQAAQG